MKINPVFIVQESALENTSMPFMPGTLEFTAANNVLWKGWESYDFCVLLQAQNSGELFIFVRPAILGFASVKYLGQCPHPRAKTWHKIWMTGLNPNYDTIPIPSSQNSQNKRQKSSFTYDRRCHLILPLPPVHTLPTLNARTCCLGAPIDYVTISHFRSHGKFESSADASCQWIIMWVIRTPITHID